MLIGPMPGTEGHCIAGFIRRISNAAPRGALGSLHMTCGSPPGKTITSAVLRCTGLPSRGIAQQPPRVTR